MLADIAENAYAAGAYAGVGVILMIISFGILDLLKVTVADGNFAATPVSAPPTRDSKAPTPKKKTNAARKTRGDDA